MVLLARRRDGRAELSGPSASAVLFDMDDTLLVDQPWVDEAMVLACRPAAARGVDPAALAGAMRRRAREAWPLGPAYADARRVGISSWEGLVIERPGPDAWAGALTGWLPAYRRAVWEAALADHGIDDAALAADLAVRYRDVRRSRYRLVDGAERLLASLRARPDVRLGLVTNGPADLQHEKIDRTGLQGRVDVVMVSGDLGTGKPDAAVFRQALAALGVPPERALMVGDSLNRDVAGARAAGLTSLWLSRTPPPPDAPAAPDLTAPDLPTAADAVERWLDGR